MTSNRMRIVLISISALFLLVGCNGDDDPPAPAGQTCCAPNGSQCYPGTGTLRNACTANEHPCAAACSHP
jgi:hypothetical protein